MQFLSSLIRKCRLARRFAVRGKSRFSWPAQVDGDCHRREQGIASAVTGSACSLSAHTVVDLVQEGLSLESEEFAGLSATRTGLGLDVAEILKL